MPHSERLNYYGFSGLIAALLSIAAYFVLKNKECWVDGGDYDNLAIIQITGTVCGSVIFLLSFFNIAAKLYDIKVLFFAVVVAIIIVGGVLFWGVYIAFTQPCIQRFKQLSSLFDDNKNAFSAEDGHNIAIVILDIVAGLTLLSIGFTFAKRL